MIAEVNFLKTSLEQAKEQEKQQLKKNARLEKEVEFF